MGKKDRKQNVQSKIAKADELFSILIRLKGMDHTGHVQCYTCDHYHHFKNIDCGHFMPRGDLTTRWLEENARPQCRNCNRNRRGEFEIFKERLEEESPGLPEYLRNLSREVANPTRADMDRIIETLAKRIKQYGGLNSVPQR